MKKTSGSNAMPFLNKRPVWVWLRSGCVILALLVIIALLYQKTIPFSEIIVKFTKGSELPPEAGNRSSPVPIQPGHSTSKPVSKNDLNTLLELLNRRLKLPDERPKVIFSEPCEKFQGKHACLETTCQRPLSLEPEARLQSILSHTGLNLSEDQRRTILQMGDSIPEKDIILVSAASSNHYDEMQAMFHNLHKLLVPLLKNVSFVLFDIGLTPEQRQMTQAKCKCQVISFPFDLYPPHVKDNHCYSWKPLIVRAVIEKARRVVIWQDASIRWHEGVQTLIDKTQRLGHQILRNDGAARVPAHTLKQTFDYMHEEPCAFSPYPEMECSFHLHKHDALTIRAVIEPWARCALEKSCMCPRPPHSVIMCTTNTKAMHQCHRFDQSALMMLLAKLYGPDLYKIVVPLGMKNIPNYIYIKREDRMENYFKTLK